MAANLLRSRRSLNVFGPIKGAALWRCRRAASPTAQPQPAIMGDNPSTTWARSLFDVGSNYGRDGGAQLAPSHPLCGQPPDSECGAESPGGISVNTGAGPLHNRRSRPPQCCGSKTRRGRARHCLDYLQNAAGIALLPLYSTSAVAMLNI